MMKKPREINRLAVLAELLAEPAHGYSLHERLSVLGFSDGVAPTTGGLYRQLRTMTEEGLLTSSWDVPEVGPARRVYELTPEGRDHLIVSRKALHDHARAIKGLLERIPRA